MNGNDGGATLISHKKGGDKTRQGKLGSFYLEFKIDKKSNLSSNVGCSSGEAAERKFAIAPSDNGTFTLGQRSFPLDWLQTVVTHSR